MVTIDDEKYDEADTKLFQLCQVADTLACIADSLEKECGKESYTASALHFTSEYLSSTIEDVRELLFG